MKYKFRENATYRKILDVSLKLFEKKGYRNTTIREIAKKSGVNQGTLYYYFDSKADLLVTLHNRVVSIILDNQKKRERKNLSEIEGVKQNISDILSLIDTHKAEFTVFFREYGNLPEKNLKLIKEIADSVRNKLQSVIKKGGNKGSFKQLDPSILVLSLLGMCNWTYVWYEHGGRLKMNEIAEIMSEVFLEGIIKRN